MFKKTLLATALLVVGSIAFAGPASAFELRCVFDPATCIIEDVIESASSDEATTGQADMPQQSRMDAEALMDAMANHLGTVQSPPVATVEMSREMIDAINDSMGIELPIDPALIIAPQPDDATESTGDSTAPEVPEASVGAPAETSPTTEDVFETFDSPQTEAPGTHQVAPEAATTSENFTASTTSPIDPIVAAVLGAALAAVLIGALFGAYAAGRRQS